MRYTVRLLSAPLTTSDASPRPSPWSSAVPASIRSSRAPLWRALASLAVLGLALFFAVTSAPRLGLDLEGGTQIVLETRTGNRGDGGRGPGRKGGGRGSGVHRPRAGGLAWARRRPWRRRADPGALRRAENYRG